MRITDIVTPQELYKILCDDITRVRSFGKRYDLSQKSTDELGDRISQEYVNVIGSLTTDKHLAAGMFRLLVLLDKFLEEKYANSPTN